MSVSYESCVLSRKGLSNGPIACPEGSYCVCVCVSLSVIKRNSTFYTYSDQVEEVRKKEWKEKQEKKEENEWMNERIMSESSDVKVIN
jgi:hypothetical protein